MAWGVIRSNRYIDRYFILNVGFLISSPLLGWESLSISLLFSIKKIKTSVINMYMYGTEMIFSNTIYHKIVQKCHWDICWASNTTIYYSIQQPQTVRHKQEDCFSFIIKVVCFFSSLAWSGFFLMYVLKIISRKITSTAWTFY